MEFSNLGPNPKVENLETVFPKEARIYFLISVWSKNCMSKDHKTPKNADTKKLWALLKTKYRDGDEMVDEEGLIWDVWRKDGDYVLYCVETKEKIEVPQPKELK